MELFVYGTLRLGDVRWKFLEPYVLDQGVPDRMLGDLYDTGSGYPAAIFPADDRPIDAAPEIIGHRYRFKAEHEPEALRVLDEIESAVTGLYHRVKRQTIEGVDVWVYQYGLKVDDNSLALSKIESGDWFEHCDPQVGTSVSGQSPKVE